MQGRVLPGVTTPGFGVSEPLLDDLGFDLQV